MRALVLRSFVAASALAGCAAATLTGAYWLEVSTVRHRHWCAEQRLWVDDRTGEPSPIDASYFIMAGRPDHR